MFCHCAAASTISPGVTEVVMLGEWSKSCMTTDDYKKSAKTTVLRFGKFVRTTNRSALIKERL